MQLYRYSQHTDIIEAIKKYVFRGLLSKSTSTLNTKKPN